ncbi:hypothetical protein [Labrys monachus]|uniref:Roadblock/LAMTOR2 domain-containing protein n=1 Tax=Labrys monachus TaxID=217067 RepID=A0ABU0F987_9HYPH|nr:hypothetical protein [Labrys monachus]MDQ0391145.1 hypothetical protein [Labrys monachus]
MVGITLTPEQIRSSPPEVRQWLEREIALSLGLPSAAEAVPQAARHLVACTVDEAGAIYMAIRGMLPVANVFFELGRKGANIGQNGVEAHQAAEMLRYARLQGPDQLAACLQVIDNVVRQLRNDPAAVLCAIDPRGYCIVASQTQQSIANVWMQLLAGRSADRPPAMDAPGLFGDGGNRPATANQEPAMRPDGPFPDAGQGIAANPGQADPAFAGNP